MDGVGVAGGFSPSPAGVAATLAVEFFFVGFLAFWSFFPLAGLALLLCCGVGGAVGEPGRPLAVAAGTP